MKSFFTKFSAMWICVVLLISMFCGVLTAYADEPGGSSTGFDVAFVLDFSGSMFGDEVGDNDKDGITQAGTTLFIRNLPDDCHVAAVKYTNSVVPDNDSFGLTTKDEACNKIEQWYTNPADNGATYIPSGIEEAYRLLQNSTREHFIVLLTDGENDKNGDGVPDNNDQNLVSGFVDGSTKIHTIGINSSGTDINTGYLNKIAELSGTGSASVATNNDQLLNAFWDIFGEYIPGDEIEVTINGDELGLNVPDGTIAAEAFIQIMFASESITPTFTVTSPDGTQVTPTATDSSAKLEQVEQCYQISLNTPKTGNWSIKCAGVAQNDINAATVLAKTSFSFTVEQTYSVSSAANNTYEVDRPFDVSVVLCNSQFGAITNPDFYAQMSSKCSVTGVASKDYPLVLDASGCKYIGSVDDLSAGDYTIVCTAQGAAANSPFSLTESVAYNLEVTADIPAAGSSTTRSRTKKDDDDEDEEETFMQKNGKFIIPAAIVLLLIIAAVIIFLIKGKKSLLQGLMQYRVIKTSTYEYVEENTYNFANASAPQLTLFEMLGNRPEYAVAAGIVFHAEPTAQKGMSRVVVENRLSPMECSASIDGMPLMQSSAELPRGGTLVVNLSGDPSFEITVEKAL